MTERPLRLPFRYLQPAFFAGLLDDPLLFVRIRPLKQALLFDCGQLAHLAKRVVKPIAAVFVSHAHMDHVMGLPTLVRHHHASPKPLAVYGPPGITDRVEHLLHGYDWNLCEPTWFDLHVHEVHVDSIHHTVFPGAEAFCRRPVSTSHRHDQIIWSCRYATVSAELLDHKLPVLAFRLDERPPFALDPDKLAASGLAPGDWINDLKSRIWRGHTGRPVVATQAGGRLLPIDDPEGFYAGLQRPQATASLGYLTDCGATTANLERIVAFLPGLTLLCAECAFLAADLDKARASFHFCSSDLNALCSRLQPQFLLPMHLSKSYLRQAPDLYHELALPPATTLLPLPLHVVPAPLGVDDVEALLAPPQGD